jgi:hypothetical protein
MKLAWMVAALLAAVSAAAHEGHDVAPNAGFEESRPAHAFDRLTPLVGEWVAAEDGPMFERGELVSRYALTGGGTALVETFFPGGPHEMTTVFTRDGADLVLTHYCAAGNQPRMRARAPTPDARVLEFAFDGGTNLDASRDSHMHGLRMQLVGPDELIAEWQSWSRGKPDGPPKRFHLMRKRTDGLPAGAP